MSKQSSFVPNSFQTPNGFVDHVMPFLSGEEYKVLIYATRRILGFQKRQDRISISQFTDGTKNKKGKVLDTGTGLSIETVKKCLANLVSFGLMVRVAENDPKTNEGTLWSLQWSGRGVDWKALEERDTKRSTANSEKMIKARSMRQTPPCDIERTPPCDIEGGGACGIETQKTVDTQGNTDSGSSSQINPNTGRRTAAKVRGNLADAALFFGRQAVEQGEDKVEAVIATLEREFHANFPRTPKMQGIARFILGKEKDGQTLVTFAAWARRDEFNASRLYEYAEQPEKIRTRWPQAFASQSKSLPTVDQMDDWRKGINL